MLKKTLLVTCVGILLVSQNVQAGDTAQNGALGGAAGGALLGQAIGRNARGTLLGTAIGGMLGYMIGNEMEKEQGRPARVYAAPPRMIQQPYQNTADCREVEVLATVNGRPDRVYSTACYEHGAWVLQDSGRVVSQTMIIDRSRVYPPVRGYYRGHEQERWHRAGHSNRYRQCDNTRIIVR